jgi:CarD family transcriptional regulator
MYQVGEYIVHPGQGVCKVEAIAEGPTAVYELMPIGQRHPMKISFPVASEAKLRPVLSREEAQELIDQYPTIPVEDFRDRSNALEEEHFKNEIRRGTCRDTVRIVKTFRARIAQTKANNKKPPAAYERILKQASERSLSELAVALDTTPEDVMVLFQNSVEASQN